MEHIEGLHFCSIPWESDRIRFLEGDWQIYRAEKEGWYAYIYNGIDSNVEVTADLLVQYKMAEYVIPFVCSPWKKDFIYFNEDKRVNILRDFGGGKSYFIQDENGISKVNSYFLVSNKYAKVSSDEFYNPLMKKVKYPKYDFSKPEAPWEEDDLLYYAGDYTIVKFLTGRNEHKYKVKTKIGLTLVYSCDDLLRKGYAIRRNDYVRLMAVKSIDDNVSIGKAKLESILDSSFEFAPFVDRTCFKRIDDVIDFLQSMYENPDLYSMNMKNYLEEHISNDLKQIKEFSGSVASMLNEEDDKITNVIKEIDAFAERVFIIEDDSRYNAKDFKNTPFIRFLKRKEFKKCLEEDLNELGSFKTKLTKYKKIIESYYSCISLEKIDLYLASISALNMNKVQEEFNSLLNKYKNSINKYNKMFELSKKESAKYDSFIDKINEMFNTISDFEKLVREKQRLIFLINKIEKSCENIRLNCESVL